MVLKEKRVSFIPHKINLIGIRSRLGVLNNIALTFFKKNIHMFSRKPQGGRPHSDGVQITLVSGKI